MSPKRSSSSSRSPSKKGEHTRSHKRKGELARSKQERGGPQPQEQALLPPALQEAVRALALDEATADQVQVALRTLVTQGVLQVAEGKGVNAQAESPKAEAPRTESPKKAHSKKGAGAASASGAPDRATPTDSQTSPAEQAAEARPRRKGSSFPSHVKGILRKHPRGFGFVAPQDCPSIQEVFVPKQATGGALDGDLVEVEIARASFSSPKGPEGEVTKVLERGRQHLLGYVQDSQHAWIKGLDEGDGLVKIRSLDDQAVQAGDRVLLRMETWPDAESDTLGVGVVERVIGSIEDPSKDIDCAIAEFQLRSSFESDVLDEARAWGDRVQTRDLEGREDLRETECVTIDPTTAKDFDDALSVVKTTKGAYHLGVHIADVAYYVQAGSHLDREARRRCNSTYFPGRCVPMLPHELSDNLCSLKPEVNRLAVTVFMEFSPEGEMKRYRIARSVIRSAKRFTYEEALQVLEGKKRSKFKQSLELMVELCGLLKKKRAERGSVELALSDVQIQVDQAGIPTGLERHEYDITHQMVEEFMLKANEVVAAHLTKQGKPVAYRIHEAPGDADLKEFVATARALGFRVPMPPTNSDLQALFAMAKDSAHAPQLAVSFIKSMKLAYYSPDNIGHYGLGLEHYCHFTSPIRRYSDLIAQRALFGELEADLAQMTEACSEQERRSSRAEESVVRLKKLRLLQQWLLDEPMRAFPAIITRVKPNGISFELPDLMLEGFLHVRELGDDFYHFQERRMAFVGEHTGETYAYGQTISVQVLSVDLLTGNLSWALAHSLVDAPLDEYMAEPEASGDGESSRGGARKRRSKKGRGKRRGPRA